MGLFDFFKKKDDAAKVMKELEAIHKTGLHTVVKPPCPGLIYILASLRSFALTENANVIPKHIDRSLLSFMVINYFEVATFIKNISPFCVV